MPKGGTAREVAGRQRNRSTLGAGRRSQHGRSDADSIDERREPITGKPVTSSIRYRKGIESKFMLPPERMTPKREIRPRSCHLRSILICFERLWRFGLLEKRSRGRGTLQYRISQHGAARLRWLRSQCG